MTPQYGNVTQRTHRDGLVAMDELHAHTWNYYFGGGGSQDPRMIRTLTNIHRVKDVLWEKHRWEHS